MAQPPFAGCFSVPCTHRCIPNAFLLLHYNQLRWGQVGRHRAPPLGAPLARPDPFPDVYSLFCRIKNDRFPSCTPSLVGSEPFVLRPHPALGLNIKRHYQKQLVETRMKLFVLYLLRSRNISWFETRIKFFLYFGISAIQTLSVVCRCFTAVSWDDNIAQ